MHDQMNTDLYAVLGIAPDATASEISKRYKALARELHPDVSTENGAEDRFKEVTAAYDVLGDEDKRAEYDQFRSMVGGGFSDGSFTGFGSDGGFRGGSGGLDDLIGQMFAQQASAPRRGADLRASARIDFADAVRGTTLTFDGPGGSITAQVPAAIESGQTFVVAGAGAAGANGGPSGDLLIDVTVAPDARFGRRKLNLTIDVPISFTEAALGAKIKVPTFDGQAVTIKIPAGTPNGRTFRVAGRGIETAATTGDLLVSVTIDVPDSLTDEQRAAIEAYAATESPRNHINRAA